LTAVYAEDQKVPPYAEAAKKLEQRSKDAAAKMPSAGKIPRELTEYTADQVARQQKHLEVRFLGFGPGGYVIKCKQKSIYTAYYYGEPFKGKDCNELFSLLNASLICSVL